MSDYKDQLTLSVTGQHVVMKQGMWTPGLLPWAKPLIWTLIVEVILNSQSLKHGIKANLVWFSPLWKKEKLLFPPSLLPPPPPPPAYLFSIVIQIPPFSLSSVKMYLGYKWLFVLGLHLQTRTKTAIKSYQANQTYFWRRVYEFECFTPTLLFVSCW